MEEERRRKEMERGEEKKCSEGRTSVRTRAQMVVQWTRRVRVHSAFVSMAYFKSDAYASCARTRELVCAKGTMRAQRSHNSRVFGLGVEFSIHAYAYMARLRG